VRPRGTPRLWAAAGYRRADRIVLTDDNPRSEDPERIMRDICAGLVYPGRVHIQHNRAKAIAVALRAAGPDDIVLIAGKGHETVQLIGDKALPFSDRERVKAFQREWAQ
jgi:UDP-N-acetylmuramoyl-L-alanyl-D-glutamate--2,6-diaminopimelate ligase